MVRLWVAKKLIRKNLERKIARSKTKMVYRKIPWRGKWNKYNNKKTRIYRMEMGRKKSIT